MKRYVLPARYKDEYASYEDQVKEHALSSPIIDAYNKQNIRGSDAYDADKVAILVIGKLSSKLGGLGFPTRYLDTQVGELLLNTDIPGDLSTDDIKWPWGAFRIMIPRSLSVGHDWGDIRYIDVGFN